jgi:hypothetical protein
MRRTKRGALALLCLMWALTVRAGGHDYSLDCLPGGDAGLNVGEVIRSRLELHDWREKAGDARFHVCFRLEARQVMVPDPVYPGPGGFYAGAAPAYRVQTVRVLSLRVSKGAGAVWREDSEPLGEDSPAAIDEAVRALIDRLPLD